MIRLNEQTNNDFAANYGGYHSVNQLQQLNIPTIRQQVKTPETAQQKRDARNVAKLSLILNKYDQKMNDKYASSQAGSFGLPPERGGLKEQGFSAVLNKKTNRSRAVENKEWLPEDGTVLKLRDSDLEMNSDEKRYFDFHTHPNSIKHRASGWVDHGGAPSPSDIVNMSPEQGSINIIQSENARYAIVIDDAEKFKRFANDKDYRRTIDDMQSVINETAHTDQDNYKLAHGNMQGYDPNISEEKGLKSYLQSHDMGISIYKTTDTKKTIFSKW